MTSFKTTEGNKGDGQLAICPQVGITPLDLKFITHADDIWMLEQTSSNARFILFSTLK